MSNRALLISDSSSNEIAQLRPLCSKKWLFEKAESLSSAKSMLSKDSDPHVILLDSTISTDELENFFAFIESHNLLSECIILGDLKDFPSQINSLIYDHLPAPFEEQRFASVVERALRSSKTRRRLHHYSQASASRFNQNALLGNSKAIKHTKDFIQQLSEVPISSIVICGETGTGKGLIAKIIHNKSLRKDGPLVELNCAALPKELLESQLFGHEAGAFTGAKARFHGLFEQADGGSLFLDEIGDMDIDLQVKLLKAIEDHKIRRIGSEKEIHIDVQIIAATSLDLEEAVRTGSFRADLFHRLSVFNIHLPPLRERMDDMIELVPNIIAEYNTKANKKVEFISNKVWEKLLNYNWPGNIRELRNVIERCILLSNNKEFPEQWLQLSHLESPTDEHALITNANHMRIPIDGSMTLEEIDRAIIKAALENNGFNVTETARVLGTTRETLRYRIQKYALTA